MNDDEITFYDYDDYFEEAFEKEANFDEQSFYEGFHGIPSTKQKESYDNDYSESKEMQFLQSLASDSDMDDVESFIEAYNYEKQQSQIEAWGNEGYDYEEIESILEEEASEREFFQEMERIARIHQNHHEKPFNPNVDEIPFEVFQLMEESGSSLSEIYEIYCQVASPSSFLSGFNSI